MMPGRAQTKSLGSMPQVRATGHQTILVNNRTASVERKDSNQCNRTKQTTVKRRLRPKAAAPRLKMAIKTPDDFAWRSLII